MPKKTVRCQFLTDRKLLIFLQRLTWFLHNQSSELSFLDPPFYLIISRLDAQYKGTFTEPNLFHACHFTLIQLKLPQRFARQQ
jgi:hypothetical protein